MKRLAMWCLFMVLAVGTSWVYADEGTKAYHILQQVKLPDEGGWDYLNVDSDARRIYITHETEVLVLDADTYKVIRKVEGIQGAHGVALAPELGKGFATSGKSGTVVVFDLKTLKKISEITGQKDADAIVYDSATTQVFTFNGDSANSTVINAATGQVVKTLNLGGSPEFAVADGHGHIFDCLEDKNVILEIDTQKLEIENKWPLSPAEKPSGIAMDVENTRLFIGCRNKLLAVMKPVPTPTQDNPKPHRKMVPGTFRLIILGQ